MDNSPLKRLPPELRLQVYEYAFYDTAHRIGQSTPGSVHEHQKEHLALTSTCRQVRIESMPVFIITDRVSFCCDSDVIVTWRQSSSKTHGMKTVEIHFKIFWPRLRHREFLAKRLVDIKRFCLKYGVIPVLKLQLPWDLWARKMALDCTDDFEMRIEGCNRRAVEDVLDQNVKEAIYNSGDWQQGLFFPTHAQEVTEMSYKCTWRLLKSLDNEPTWSWLQGQIQTPQERAVSRDWAQYLDAGPLAKDLTEV